VFALEEIERQVLRGLPGAQPSRLRDALDEAMTRHPEHWAAYYRGSPEEVRRKRAFSYSDRCRYYWPQPEVQEALAGLLRNLSERPIPLPLIGEFLPESSRAVQEGRLAAEPVALVRHHIQRVLDLYAAACDDDLDETGGRGPKR
jgi:D-tagatose-1,6-bisphosphate aldolase subunit GatZ/KbaZ